MAGSITVDIGGGEQYMLDENGWHGANPRVVRALDGFSDSLPVGPDEGDPIYVIGHKVAKQLHGRVVEYVAPAAAPRGTVY